MANNSGLFINIGEGLSIKPGLPTIATWKTSGRPKNPKRGTFGFNSQTSSLEYWDGSDWFGASMNEE